MKKFTLSLLVTLLAGVQLVLAQDIRVTGKVTDNTGVALPGVSVIVPGTDRGVTTLTDGTYAISAPANATLQFSFVGMNTIDIPVNNRTVINMVMESDTQAIDEVIVVAFGTSTKGAFTGSAGVVKSEDLTKSQQSNVAQTLAGRISGVQIANSSGQPNASPSVRIRGFSSITALNNPLWVVDGVPYEGDLNLLSSNDVESITVLKDAASTALYGARGANGVIMVTTKKGRSREATIVFDAKVGVNMRALKEYEYINDPGTYYETHYNALRNYYLDNSFSAEESHARANTTLVAPANSGGLAYMIYTVPDGQDFIQSNGKMNPNATMGRKVSYNGKEYWLQSDNWYDEAYRTSIRQEYNASISGLSDRGSFYSSFGYLNNQGIVYNSDFTRFTTLLKADYQAKKWLNIGGNISYSRHDSNSLSNEGSSGSTANVFAFTAAVAPIYPVYVRDGQGNIMTNESGITISDYGDGTNAGLTRPFLAGSNALSSTRLNTNNSEGNGVNASGFLEVTILPELKFRFNAGTTMNEYRTTTVSNPYFGQFAGEKGIVGKYHQRTFGQNYTQILTYEKHFNGVHNLNVSAMHDYYRRQTYYLYGSKANMFSQSNKELAGAIIDKQSASSYTTDYNVEGFMGRLEYNYDNTYYFSGSFRRDGSSRFYPDSRRWGNFWSLSGAWILSREEFLSSASSWLDLLKFKFSYGEQGNDAIPNYRYTDTYEIENSNGSIGLIFYAKGNNNITWETVANLNTGFDFSFKNGLVSGNIEYFNRMSRNMLFSFPVAPSMGYSSYYANIGDMQNKGIELDLNVSPIRNKNLRWDINFNVTHLKNKITMLPDERKTLEIDGVKGYVSSATYYGEGASLYTHYLKKYAGVSEEGKSLWYQEKTDDAGNKVMETTDNYSNGTYHLCGNPIPDVYGGFGSTLNFYGFDFSINFNYQIGGLAYDSGYAASMYVPNGETTGQNWHIDMLNAWSSTNTSSNIPRLQYGDLNSNSSSDRFLKDASFLNLQNINLGYTLPKKLTDQIGMSSVRIYAAVENVVYWSKRKGFDPRYSFSGTTSQATYSPIRTISGGVTLRF